ncbi:MULTISPECIES: hypothetical protein [unclassified Vibrio]|uniref:hypothetical protein n=1 Tax=unclassified Vibrio TaxID=2614977 RepID=UPI0025568DDC|nr:MULTISPECIES: hypothetical protein [unclassified Vibrio]MDK9777996.1 hypothetical protein [Vibrio sp. D401a]MDK9801497.1 hypothetical protein [Vibrio sp. D406a]
MDTKTRAELGDILTDQEKLLDILAQNPGALEAYPNLQSYLTDKNQKSVAYRRAIRNKEFTKEDYRDEILSKLDWFGYKLCTDLDMDFIINNVAAKYGDDINAVRDITLQDIGIDKVSRLLHMMGEAIYSQSEVLPSFPWEAKKGQTNHAFWKKCHLAFDAMMEDGYTSHYKLNEWSQLTLGVSCPQSFPRFARTYGDPRLIESWVKWSGWSE